jgi:hypothetical protein
MQVDEGVETLRVPGEVVPELHEADDAAFRRDRDPGVLFQVHVGRFPLAAYLLDRVARSAVVGEGAGVEQFRHGPCIVQRGNLYL